MLWWLSFARSKRRVWLRPAARCLKSKTSSLIYLDNNMALSDAEALKNGSKRSRRCSLRLRFLHSGHGAQTDGFDRCPRFLRRHEVCYMEAHFVMG